jgi:hypothetical protein
MNKVKQAIRQLSGNAPVQTLRAVVTDVDADAETCTVESSEGIETFDVLLSMHGYGLLTIPKTGANCLVGIIQNQNTSAFLIWADAVERYEIRAENIKLNGDAYGGIVDAKELSRQIEHLNILLKAIQNAFKIWITVPNDGGAALKLLSAQFTNLQTADLSNIENKNITHG